MRGVTKFVTTALFVMATATQAGAELLERYGTFGGLALTYKVLLPAAFDPAREYPVVLVFTGGPQQLQIAEMTVTTDWKPAAERRGYIIMRSGTPDGSLFFQRADRVFPSFLDQTKKDHRVKGGRLHVAGHSNGGLSAFHVAAKYPGYFSTVTGYPGLLDGDDLTRSAAIQPLCVFMHVGDMDNGWRGAMEDQA